MAAESELYLVVSGCGNVRDKNGVPKLDLATRFLFQPAKHISLATPAMRILFIT